MVNNIQNRQRRWLLSYRRIVILIFHKKQHTCVFFYYLLHRVTLLMTWNKKIFFAKREENSVLSSSIQLGGISRFRLLGYFWAWRYQHILGPKNQTRKIVKIHKNFELYQVFMFHELFYIFSNIYFGTKYLKK